MISIKLDPSVFAPGGIFFGVPVSRAVIVLGTGKPNEPSGQTPFNPNNQNFINSAFSLPVTYSGVEIYDITLQIYRQNALFQGSFGQQLLDYMQRGVMDVFQNGTQLTPDQVLNFTAP